MHTGIGRILGALVLSATAVAAGAAPVPRADYTALMRIDGLAQPVRVSHRQGIVRTEATVQGRQLVGLLDLRSGEITVLGAEGGLKLATTLPPGSMPQGLPVLDVRRVDTSDVLGRASVLGRDCTVYRVRERGRDLGTACLDRLDIPLAFDAVVDGRRARGEAISLATTAQAPALFEVPPDYQPLRLPAGLPAIPGLTAPR